MLLVAPRVIDGDTLEAQGVRYRVVGVDAPEIGRAKCPLEKAAGLSAKAHAERMIGRAKRVVATDEGRDRYGRTLAHVRVDGVDLGDALVASGHARRWTPPGPRPTWC